MKFVTHAYFACKVQPKKQTFNRFRDKIKVAYSENGNKEFIKVGSTDMYALAQSHKDACLIENIIKRATNDPSVLQRTVGQYCDLTAVPENMFDALGVIEDAKKTFADLPQTIKDSYNNSFDTFLGSFKTATGLAKFLTATKKAAAPEKTVETVKTNESEVNSNA